MSLPPWVRALPNRGLLYERLVLDNLPPGARAVARGARGAPFDLVVREPTGETTAWGVKGNELDARGALPERRRFSASPRQVRWVEANAARVRLCFLWLDAPRGRFGFRVLPASEVRWKSPASPKWVLPADAPIPLRKVFSRYAEASAGERLRARWERLPEVDAPPVAAPAQADGRADPFRLGPRARRAARGNLRRKGSAMHGARGVARG